MLFRSREQKRLSVGSVRSNSFETEQSSGASTRRITSAPQTGYKIFPPGVYEYSFEITLDHRCPETMNLPMGSVRWRLESLVERHGTFKTNLRGTQEVLVVRAPQVQAEDQLYEPQSFLRHYDDVNCHILIQGTAFPIGGKIPITFRFTPLEKVEVHEIWLSILEETTYYCKNRALSKKTDREVKIFEKKAGRPIPEEFGGGDVRFTEGGELSPELRAKARAQAESLRQQMSNATGVAPEPLPEASDNLLGDLDLGLDHFISQTVMEVDLMLPTCEKMRKSTSKILHPSSSFKVTQVEHFLKASRYVRLCSWTFTNLAQFYVRTGKRIPHPSGVPKRVSDTVGYKCPIMLLSCLATLDRTTLPIYPDDSNPGAPSQTAECGCPNATTITSSSLTTASRNDLLAGSNIVGPDLPVPPSGPGDSVPTRIRHIRPIQMLRYPSYAPPPFDADQPPPPIISPPPNYDNVIGTPSHDGLADYFARMANVYDNDQAAGEEENETEDERQSETGSESGNESKIRQNTSRNGRVYISNPMTPGQRAPSHSLEINRTFMFQRELFETMQEVQAEGGATSGPAEPQLGDNTSRA